MTISMDPGLFDIGSLTIGWHAIMMVIGIILAIWLSGRTAPKEGIPPQAVYMVAFWILLFGFTGARLTHVIDDLDYYRDHVLQSFAFWEGGLGWYGGYIGGMIGAVVYAKYARIPLGRLVDTVAIGVILGLAIGRIGCTINGDAYGTQTSLPWGLTYTHPGSFAELFVKGHPAPVYEIIWILVISVALWKLRERLSPPGSLFLATVAMYSLGRFFISWVRVEPSVLGPLHQSHIFSIILFVGALAFLAYRKTSSSKHEAT